MPIVYNQLIPANAGLPGYNEAKELARQIVANVLAPVAFAGVGIAGGSCNAALAILPAPGYPVIPPAGGVIGGFGPGPFPVPILGGPLPFSVVTGNSQLAAGGLAVGPGGIALGGHAERAALTAAGALPLYITGVNDAVLFVELMPCGGCQNWLNGGGGGVPNPYNGVINGAGATTLHVWYRWPHTPAGVAAMNAWHALPSAGQLADINANW